MNFAIRPNSVVDVRNLLSQVVQDWIGGGRGYSYIPFSLVLRLFSLGRLGGYGIIRYFSVLI